MKYYNSYDEIDRNNKTDKKICIISHGWYDGDKIINNPYYQEKDDYSYESDKLPGTEKVYCCIDKCYYLIPSNWKLENNWTYSSLVDERGWPKNKHDYKI